jgi:hypothetical protein
MMKNLFGVAKKTIGGPNDTFHPLKGKKRSNIISILLSLYSVKGEL